MNTEPVIFSARSSSSVQGQLWSYEIPVRSHYHRIIRQGFLQKTNMKVHRSRNIRLRNWVPTPRHFQFHVVNSTTIQVLWSAEEVVSHRQLLPIPKSITLECIFVLLFGVSFYADMSAYIGFRDLPRTTQPGSLSLLVLDDCTTGSRCLNYRGKKLPFLHQESILCRLFLVY